MTMGRSKRDSLTDITDQVTIELAKLDFEDPDISAYIASILKEESLNEEEKREAITEFIPEIENKPLEDVIDGIMNAPKMVSLAREKEDQEDSIKRMEEIKLIKDQEAARRIEEEKQREEEKRMAALGRKELSKEEREKRERLLQQYSYGGTEDSDDEQNTGEKSSKDKRTVGTQDEVMVANRNAEIIKEKEALRRKQMKQESEVEKERNKMLQKKQKQDKDKDKDKKKTVKKEKKRM
ncbi:hypothetical protein CLU79DRAFT_770632 [Phycomyces nitens]|nr:hypothetical protein CLU79DRAFT_770632 [Phycomyces nitens]